MTNHQLAAHCRDVIANPQDHLDWVVDMARVALGRLETEPVAWVVHGHGGDQLTDDGDYVANVEGMHGARATSLYTAPPLPELKPIELPVMQVDNPIDGFFYRCDEVIEAIRAAGYEVKA